MHSYCKTSFPFTVCFVYARQLTKLLYLNKITQRDKGHTKNMLSSFVIGRPSKKNAINYEVFLCTVLHIYANDWNVCVLLFFVYYSAHPLRKRGVNPIKENNWKTFFSQFGPRSLYTVIHD